MCEVRVWPREREGKPVMSGHVWVCVGTYFYVSMTWYGYVSL